MSAIPRRVLGASGRPVSVLGLGCAGYWARPGFPPARARAVLETALACGIELFDTGASYAGGHAERRLGALLRELDGDPDALLIATKVGTVADERGRVRRDFRPRAIAAQVEASLRRLGVERVGLVSLHGPVAADLGDELLTALERLRAEGKTALVGINAGRKAIAATAGCNHLDVVMPFVSVAAPENADLARSAGAAGRGVIAAEPLARMRFAPPLARWLTRPAGWWYLARAVRHDPAGLLRRSPLARALRAPGWTPAQLALAWVLAREGVSAAVIGTTDPGHVRELAAAATRELPPPVSAALDELHRREAAA